MRICVTAQTDSLESEIDPRFGRCSYFIFVDSDSMQFEAEQNPSVSAMGGAGVQAGQLVADKEAQVVLTGNVGPNAFQTLKAANIEIITGVSGNIKEAVEKYKNGKLKSSEDPNVGSKFGMK